MSAARRTLRNPDATVPHGSPETSLYSEGAFPGADGTVLAPAGSPARRIPDTPFLDPDSGRIEGALEPSADEIEEVAAHFRLATVPGRGGRHREMADHALLDILALRLDNGAVLGAGSSYWRFVWPRDNGLTAVALSLCGYHRYAFDALRFVYECQEADGQFEARYLPDGSGEVPDDRGRQHDGIGYTLWATATVTALAGERADDEGLDDTIRHGTERAVQAGLELLDPGTGLPRPSQDYWESDLAVTSLGVAAPLLAGLEAATHVLTEWGRGELAAETRTGASALATGIGRHFGPLGYERFAGGGMDASLVLLLPPFRRREDIEDLDALVSAWHHALRTMRIDNGGFRPGEKWADDQTAWNPQLSLYAANAAALGDKGRTDEFLDWLADHRTAMGCLPEKVTITGKPAAVAPINCVAAAVLIALAVIDGRTLDPHQVSDPRPTCETGNTSNPRG